jgi:hypothetical protein
MISPDQRDSPYQGLTPFDERDAAYFFGRQKDIRLIVADLFASPLTLLYGESGVGKSSVLRAGVMPALHTRDDIVAVVFSTWQTEPVDALKRAVAESLVASGAAPSSEELEKVGATLPLAAYLRECRAITKRRLMIVLDQFEEYSLYHPVDDAFAREFPEAVAGRDLSASFLLSLREEAVSRLDRFEGRIPTLFDNYRRCDHLTVAAARSAIEEPIRKYNEDHPNETTMTIEPELVEAVLEQVQTGRVHIAGGGEGTTVNARAPSAKHSHGRIEAPYLQLVMSRIWNEERREGSNVLHWETLARLGGAPKIVQRHLDEVMGQFTEAQKDIAASVFQLLVTPSGTKIAHMVGDLADHAGVGHDELAAILDALARGSGRILRPVAALPDFPDEPRYEIFHDRLAPAILDWRRRRLEEHSVLQAAREQIQRNLVRVSRDESTEEAIERRAGTSRAEGSKMPARASAWLNRAYNAPAAVPPYERIVRLMRDRRVVVILGAGVSSSSRPPSERWTLQSPYLPTGSELTALLAADADFPRDELGNATLAEVASYCQSVLGRRFLDERLAGIFDRPETPAPLHRVLARLARTTPLVILTTTFDSALEQALAEERVPHDVLAANLASAETPVIWRPDGAAEAQSVHPKSVTLSADRSIVYKVFGSFERRRPELSCFALSEEDEVQLFGELSGKGGRMPPLFIREALATKHLLFVGMGLQSWTQRLLVSTLRDRARSETPVNGWSIVRTSSRVDVVRWRNASVEVFDIDINDFARDLGQALEATPERPA